MTPDWYLIITTWVHDGERISIYSIKFESETACKAAREAYIAAHTEFNFNFTTMIVPSK